MARREFSKAVLRAALARADGRCEGLLTDGSRCPCPLQVGRFQYDHIIPAALTEDASLDNCQVLCRPCHAAKTVVDVGVIARVRRVRDRHAGIADQHRRLLSGSKARPFKRLIGGGVILRDTGKRLDRGATSQRPRQGGRRPRRTKLSRGTAVHTLERPRANQLGTHEFARSRGFPDLDCGRRSVRRFQASSNVRRISVADRRAGLVLAVQSARGAGPAAGLGKRAAECSLRQRRPARTVACRARRLAAGHQAKNAQYPAQYDSEA